MIRVLVVDDHPWFREGVVFELARAEGIAVVGEASDGREALSQARRHKPDVVLLDLAMPVVDGATALPDLLGLGARVLVLTLAEEDATVLACIRAGADGYLVKGVPPTVSSTPCVRWRTATRCSVPGWQPGSSLPTR
ncbi:response regulator transcription factor [Mumia zhuanghuii]|uniref:Response regulator transcription factor n=2 Tax=Mumia TaxID=1546255 RepID=A0ABW1QJU8_9ACTN|nr:MULTISPECIES: response regulator transcription factor [Mumia]KAA1419751.1 response regulator transcription factor [Mumia zhuanghuii]